MYDKPRKANIKTQSKCSRKLNNEERTCNCKIKDDCPVNGMCLTRGVIYKATVKHENKNMSYIGSKGRQFKSGYYEHLQSFNLNL